VITHPATLDVSRELAQQVSRLLHAERRRRGTRKRSRALTCFRHAVLGLRWFRHGTDITTLARDHGISRATGYRYIEEAVTVLAAQAPDLHEALERAKAAGMAYMILDGKIFSADRCGEKTTSVRPPTSICRRWPTAATAVWVSVCTRRSNTRPMARYST
jgi:hypothetical protein